MWSSLWNERSRIVFTRFGFVLACALVGASWVAWPYVVLMGAWRLASHYRKTEACSIVRGLCLFVQLATSSFRIRMRPHECYYFGLLGRGAQAAFSEGYMSEALVSPIMRARNDRFEITILSDKKNFAEYFETRRLRVSKTLCLAHEGRLEGNADFFGFGRDLFFKPRFGARSEGVERWWWNGRGYCKSFSNTIVDAGKLVDRLLELSMKQDYLVQFRLQNHPNLEDLSIGGVIVFRILSVRCGDTVKLVAPVAQLPYENKLGEGWSEKTLSVAVDLETGVLSHVLWREEGFAMSCDHPASGASMIGRKVPDWELGLTMLREAHETLSGICLIGWDLVFTPEGPCLLEGNSGPALVVHQLKPFTPLGRTPLGRVLEATDR